MMLDSDGVFNYAFYSDEIDEVEGLDDDIKKLLKDTLRKREDLHNEAISKRDPKIVDEAVNI